MTLGGTSVVHSSTRHFGNTPSDDAPNTPTCCVANTAVDCVHFFCEAGGGGMLTFTLLCDILTYCMVQSPSWEATWFVASQEIPRISRNPKVHYRTHKRPPTVPILGQPNPVHIPTYHPLQIHPNIIHPSTTRSPQWSFSHRLTHQDPIHPSLITHTRHMPSQSHYSRFYHPHNIGWGVQII